MRTWGCTSDTHRGEDHTGQSIGLLHLTPWEATVVAADVAMKSGNVELGFLDRFSGAVILLGSRAEVKSALEHVVEFSGRSWASPSVNLRSGDKER